ncbi:CCC motif membrane protein [Lacinutrix salivirga]
MKKQLNPTLVYVLAIIGLLCCCFGGLGFILAGIAFYIAHTKIKDAQLNPDAYEGDIKAMNTAKTVALIILIINVLYLLYTAYQIYTVGWDEMMEQSRQIMEQYEAQQ